MKYQSRTGLRTITRPLWFALVLLAASAGLAAEKEIILGADVWCPYNCSVDGERPGYLIDLSKEIFAEHGYRIKYVILPWERALKSAKTGRIQAAIGAVRGNVDGHYIGRQSLGRDETILVVRNGEKFEYRGVSSLDHKRLGVITNYTYDNHGEIDRYIARKRKEGRWVTTIYNETPLDSLLKMLVNRRIDAFLENKNVAVYKAKQLGVDRLIDIVETGTGDEIFFAFTPNAQGRALAGILDDGIIEFHKSGRLKQLLDIYGIPDWQ
jgi:polar amino acid transport system substrate-binding protein